MKLINNWRKAWKFNSVQTAIILGLANAAFALMPALSEHITVPVYAGVSAIGNIAIILLRLVAQPKLQTET